MSNLRALTKERARRWKHVPEEQILRVDFDEGLVDVALARREGTNDPVVVIEFRRPGDARPSQDPINQVLVCIDGLQGVKVRDVHGGVVADINTATPFECFIVCELTARARALLERSIAQHSTPDGAGYYGRSSHHRAYIRV